MKKYSKEKAEFFRELSNFANSIGKIISKDDKWTIKGFIDIFKNIYSISNDTKIISKVLEIQIFPYLITFAEKIGYNLELATHQNWYPDLTFISKTNEDIKFAVDLKTTYKDDKRDGFCNGFTLGSHGEYFINRNSTKNIQYSYNEYSGHFCIGAIYSRNILDESENLKIYNLECLEQIPDVIGDFIFFAQEKWKMASDKPGSGNTANIGSIKNIEDIIKGDGVFAKAGEDIFDDYWSNYGRLQVKDKNNNRKALSSFEEYIRYRGLSDKINNSKMRRKR